MISLVIFVICYIGFIWMSDHKMLISLLGVVSLIVLQQIDIITAFYEVRWNVMGLFVGTLILAELFMYSRVPAVLAEWLVGRSKTIRGALIRIFILTSTMSMVVESVAVVLIIAPVVLTLCEKLKISPVLPIVLLAMFTNLQGTATLIGSPPSMIVGSYIKMTFGDFFVYTGKPSIFFMIQVGAFFTLCLTFFLFRHFNQVIELIKLEQIRSWIPSLLFVVLIIGLSAESSFDLDSTWMAGSFAMGLATIGIIWNQLGPKWASTKQIIKTLDWSTILFLMALCILVESIRLAGWMDLLAVWIVNHIPPNLLVIYLFILSLSVLASAFIDNVPYVLAMIPVVQQVADNAQFPLPLLIFALLIGSCLGGNIIPIGAAANIAAISFLEKNGYTITFPSYLRYGVLFTVFALIPTSLALWMVWAEY